MYSALMLAIQIHVLRNQLFAPRMLTTVAHTKLITLSVGNKFMCFKEMDLDQAINAYERCLCQEINISKERNGKY